MDPNLIPSRWARWADFAIRYDRWIVGIVLALTILFAFWLPQLRFGTRMVDFYRKSTKDLVDTLDDKFNEANYLAIIFESKGDQSLLSPKLLHQQYRVMEAIHKNFKVVSYSLVEGIDEALRQTRKKSILDYEDYTPIAQAILALSGPKTVKDLVRVSQSQLSDPEAINFYSKLRVLGSLAKSPSFGSTKTTYGIPQVKAVSAFLQLDQSYPEKDRQKIFVEMRDMIQKVPTPDVGIYPYGTDLIGHDIDSHTTQNAALMVLILVVLDGLILWWTFRSRREVLLTSVILFTSIIWAFGMAAMLSFQISYLQTIVLPILLGTGIDDSVVFGRRFAEERKNHQSFPEVLRSTFSGTGTSIFLTTFTTFIAFVIASLASSTKGLFEFCILVSISMVTVFVLTVLMQGAMRSLLDKRYGEPLPSTPSPFFQSLFNGISQIASHWIGKRPRTILMVSCLLFLGALAGGMKLESEFDARLYMRKSMPSYQADKVEEKYFGNRLVGYILFEGEVENPELLKKMRLLEKKLGQYPLIAKVLGQANVNSITELINKLRIPITPQTPVRSLFDKIATNKAKANYVTGQSYQEEAKSLLHKNGGKYDALVMKILIQLKERKEDTKKIVDLYHAIIREVKNLGLSNLTGVQVRVGGGQLINYVEQLFYFKNFIWSFFLSLILNALVLLIFWKNIRQSLKVMAPLVLAVTLTMGMMVLFGIKLNVLNLAIGTITIGLGIDYPIHLVERFQEEKMKNPEINRVKAMQNTLSGIGQPLFGSALTTVVGFGAATVLAMPLAASFGILTALAVLLAYLSSIFLLPVLLIGWRN